MSALCPYLPGEVVETKDRRDSVRYWVRDAEETYFQLVEYLGSPSRLTCYCDDGEAHAESPDTEPECPHLRAAVEHRMAEAGAVGRSRAPINLGSFYE